VDRCSSRTRRSNLSDKLFATGKLVADLGVTVGAGTVTLRWRSEYCPIGALVSARTYGEAIDALLAEEHRRRESGTTGERSACGD
jgi:hypothetical protein